MVLADTVLVAEMKEPKNEIATGEAIKTHLHHYVKSTCRRTMSANALQCILSFGGFASAYHNEQCTLAEYCAHFVRDVVAHSQLAADARVKPRAPKNEAVNDSESDDECDAKSKIADFSIVDVGGGGNDDDIIDDTGDLRAGEKSDHPLDWKDPQAAVDIALQAHAIATSQSKTRRSHVDKQLLALRDAYGPVLNRSFSLQPESARGAIGFHFDAVSFKKNLTLQKSNIAHAKTQAGHSNAEADDDEDHVTEHNRNAQPASCAVLVDLPLAQKGPPAVARYLIEEARCTEEQVSAIAGLARDWQNAWEARTNKESHLFTGLCVI